MLEIFRELNGELARNGKTQKSLAKLIHRSYGHVNQCFAGERQFRHDDMYKIMDVLNIPYGDMSRVFPRR